MFAQSYMSCIAHPCHFLDLDEGDICVSTLCTAGGSTKATDVHSILTAVAHGRVDISDASRSIEEISSGLHVRPRCNASSLSQIAPRTISMWCSLSQQIAPPA
jgi:hypothetical protein